MDTVRCTIHYRRCCLFWWSWVACRPRAWRTGSACVRWVRDTVTLHTRHVYTMHFQWLSQSSERERKRHEASAQELARLRFVLRAVVWSICVTEICFLIRFLHCRKRDPVMVDTGSMCEARAMPQPCAINLSCTHILAYVRLKSRTLRILPQTHAHIHVSTKVEHRTFLPSRARRASPSS